MIDGTAFQCEMLSREVLDKHEHNGTFKSTESENPQRSEHFKNL